MKIKQGIFLGIAFVVGGLLGMVGLKYYKWHQEKKIPGVVVTVLGNGQKQVKEQIPADSVPRFFHFGLVLRGDKVCQALFCQPYYRDTEYYRPSNILPQNYDQALVYGKRWASLSTLKAWCIRHDQRTFALYVGDIVASCVYYRYVRKGERFHIFEPLRGDTAYWKADQEPSEGWVKVWANDAYWANGDLHVKDALGAAFMWGVSQTDDK